MKAIYRRYRRLSPACQSARFGTRRRLPISREFGVDRGDPIDRYYIDDFLRRHSRVQYCELDVAPQTSGESPEQIVLRSEHHEYLADGLRLLSPRERTALLLRDVEGLPAEEVAKRLGCSKATVRSHIANARTKFRRYMERRKR